MDTVAVRLAPWSLLVLRLVVGGGLASHGLAKLARGPEHFADILAALHLPMPLALAWVIIAVELVGGSAVAAGLFVRAAAVPLSVVLVVAACAVHLPYGFSSVKLLSIRSDGAVFGPPGYEIDALYLAALAVLAFIGPGPWSARAWLSRRR